ncbi:MAG: hypothetical protein ACLQVN_11690 [Bryobacteraceae bacterium]
MKKIALLFPILACLPLMAEVSGTVVNRTTGQPQVGATVTLYKFGQGGMEAVASAKTDAAGAFRIAQDAGGQGPSMLRVEVDNVTYNHMCPPGTPTTGVTFDVYNASKRQPADVKVSKHMILFQPSGGQMTVSETYLVDNTGKTTWFDPDAGTLPFYLPAAAGRKVEISATAPDGMAVPAPSAKTARADTYAAKFEIKPGETRIDLSYAAPYTEGAAYAGRVATKDENTYLIAPKGVTLEAQGLQDLGSEPRTQARIYGLNASSYSVKLTGAVDTAAAAPAESADDSAAQDSGPQIEQIMPRIYSRAGLILGLALGILTLGFVLLYRAQGNA